jgi:hypothetical protein
MVTFSIRFHVFFIQGNLPLLLYHAIVCLFFKYLDPEIQRSNI